MKELNFIHRFEAAADRDQTPILLLHGTGGNEDDLVPLGKELAPGAALLSPRGKVLENGMPRFFRRLREGVFDEPDVVRRAGELADFITSARKSYALAAPIAVGFSNGANIAAALLLLQPEALAGAVLLRAMVPLSKPPRAKLAGKPVLILSGSQDPIIPAENAQRLANMLKGDGADVEHRIIPSGHGLTQADLTIARQWLATHSSSLART